MKNYAIRAIGKNSSVRIFIADTTEIVREIRKIHESSATASAALGRLATAALLMGITEKDAQNTLTIRFDGNGVGGKLTAISNSKGEVKVTATNTRADAPSKYPGKLDVGAFVGRQGQLAIIKDFGLKEPYTGISEIVTGEIGDDLASYYFYSEQTPTILSLGVLVDTDLSIKSAGGIFVQAMPMITEDELSKLEAIANNLKPISQMLNEGMTAEEILYSYFKELGPQLLEKQELKYECDCSRERIEAGLISLGKNELAEILEEEGHINVVCDFCRKEYNFDDKDIKKFIAESR